MLKLGAHVAFSKSQNYFEGAIKFAQKIGANTIMIFLGAPQNTIRPSIKNFNLPKMHEDGLFQIINPHDIIVHAPYIVNPASKTKQDFAISFLISEAQLAEKCGIKYMVLHPGSSVGISINDAIINASKTIQTVICNTASICIVIETMAGKGSEIGVTFEQIAQIIKLVNSERIGVCLDTCHIWDAGYNIFDFENVLLEFDKKIGLKYLKVIHLNDSKNDCGSHKDRHENIGAGKIGLDALKKVVKHNKLDNISIILETPWIDKKICPYEKEIKLLKGE